MIYDFKLQIKYAPLYIRGKKEVKSITWKATFFYFLLQKRLKRAVSNKRDDDIARAITTPYSGCVHLHFTNFHTSKNTCSLCAVLLTPVADTILVHVPKLRFSSEYSDVLRSSQKLKFSGALFICRAMLRQGSYIGDGTLLHEQKQKKENILYDRCPFPSSSACAQGG